MPKSQMSLRTPGGGHGQVPDQRPRRQQHPQQQPALIRAALQPQDQEDQDTVPGETRRERFERLATSRVRRVLKDLRLIGNLASDNYEYNEEDALLIEDTLREQVDAVLALFKPKIRSSRGELAFSFHRIREESEMG